MGFDHRFSRALVRQPPMTADRGLTAAGLGAPEYPLLAKQHVDYVTALRAAGLKVEILPAVDDLPDSYFVEDAAVVLPELAVLARMEVHERTMEPVRLGPTLSRWFQEIAQIELPGALEGGDVLLTGEVAFIGISGRTNRAGAEQLAEILGPQGFEARMLEVGAGLHLKSGLSAVAEGTLLAAPEYAGRAELAGFEVIELPEAERYAANALRVNDTLFIADGYPEARASLAGLPGVRVEALAMSEMAKMDGGLSCLSLRW